jgi:hypothetical protein
MSPSFGDSLQVIGYRDFYDVPRLFICSDAFGNYWVFDCQFDEITEEYSDQYTVFFLGKQIEGVRKVFDRFTSPFETRKPCAHFFNQLSFDSSRRKSFQLSRN